MTQYKSTTTENQLSYTNRLNWVFALLATASMFLSVGMLFPETAVATEIAAQVEV